MRRELVELLACPACLGELRVAFEEKRSTCGACGASFAFAAGTPSFLVPRIQNFFEGQWQLWLRGRLGGGEVYGLSPAERTRHVLGTLGVDEAAVAGKTVLDAGTGHGQVAKELAARGALVVGMDLSGAALGEGADNLLFVLADYLYCPFRPETFDIVISSGVVHHTEEPLVSMMNVAKLVKKGGLLYLYVYEPGTPKYLKLRRLFPASHAYPATLLYALSLALAPVAWLAKRASGGATSLGNAALGIHDALVPRYAHEISPERITRTLESAGFREAARVGPCVYRARR
jgi:SAM-dependent methyltransferase